MNTLNRDFARPFTLILVACKAFMTPSAQAHILVDPGFETNPLPTATHVLNRFSTHDSRWRDNLKRKQ